MTYGTCLGSRDGTLGFQHRQQLAPAPRGRKCLVGAKHQASKPPGLLFTTITAPHKIAQFCALGLAKSTFPCVASPEP